MLSLGRSDRRKPTVIYIEERELTIERKTVRVSKGPEMRRQEILDTTTKALTEKGYEAVTMRDIVAAMNVVPGLCYRYFEFKQVLYDTVVEQYVKEITPPMIRTLEEDQGKTEKSLEQFLDSLEQLSLGMNSRERCHHSFHKKENRHLQMLLSVWLCEATCPYLGSRLGRMRDKGMMKVGNLSLTASYLLFDAASVTEDDGLSSREEMACIR